MPRREFEAVAAFESCVAGAEELIFDGTETLTVRPQGQQEQKEKYSGKKHTHTDIALVLSDKRTRIYYVSRLYDGKNVDMGILKKEFTPGKGWFKDHKVLFDLGFVGVEKLYTFKELIIGEKRQRKSKACPKPRLTAGQKEKNRKISKERIFVEHAIGRMKRFHILRNRCRMKCQILKDRIIGICAALWNYRLELWH